MKNKELEIIYGDSLNYTMKKSKLKENKIIMFNTLFSISDLTKVKEYKIKTKKELNPYDENYTYKSEVDLLNKYIEENYKIRIWSSHKDIESYLLLLYICDKIKDKNVDAYVTYSEDYENCPSPSCLKEEELESLSLLNHKLTKEEINEFSKIWNNLVETNSHMRVIKNGKVLNVDYKYFDEIILNKLKELKTTTISKLVANLMMEYHIRDIEFTYFIDELIKQNKIKIIEKDKERHFLDKIELVK